MAEVQAISVLLELSADSGNTWKQLICLTSAGFDAQRTSEKTETQCGTFTGISTVSWGFDFEAQVNTTPTASQLSYKDVLNYFNSGTKLLVRQQSPDDTTPGADFFISGEIYITSIRNSTPMQGGKMMAFSGRLEGSGVIDIAP